MKMLIPADNPERGWKTNANVIVHKNVIFIALKIWFILRERGKEEEREGQKHRCVVVFCVPHTGDRAMCPDWELNQQPFISQVGT